MFLSYSNLSLLELKKGESRGGILTSEKTGGEWRDRGEWGQHLAGLSSRRLMICKIII